MDSAQLLPLLRHTLRDPDAELHPTVPHRLFTSTPTGLETDLDALLDAPHYCGSTTS
ncbi:hypothetical protein ACLMAJ_10090 [Nocardia sp. KC 131]|uniref:hypothetical protein n=1 Tax=Nocardia arseniciresistens TaxID=3392119 RepID=UPI00398F80CF